MNLQKPLYLNHLKMSSFSKFKKIWRNQWKNSKMVKRVTIWKSGTEIQTSRTSRLSARGQKFSSGGSQGVMSTLRITNIHEYTLNYLNMPHICEWILKFISKIILKQDFFIKLVKSYADKKITVKSENILPNSHVYYTTFLLYQKFP